MTMRYDGPTKLKVGCNSVTITPTQFPEKETAKFADFDSWTYEIRLSKDDMSRDILKQTIMHELIHAIEYSNVSTPKLKEVQVEQLASGLYSLIRDNKNLTKWIQGA